MAPFAALMLVFLLGMVAFAIDMGYIVVTRTDLQNAADAAALAGASVLDDAYVNYLLPGQTSSAKATILSTALSNARTKAKLYATYNAAGNVKSLSLLDADIEFGSVNASGVYSSSYTGFPNTIKVILRRDANANGTLPLFIAPVVGTNTATLTATASATIYTGTLNNLSTDSSGMLPVAYDVGHWNTFVSTGKDPDGNTSLASDGSPQLQVYPSVKYKGNFGLLSLDSSHVGASTISNWIASGLSQDDINSLTAAHLIPLSQHSANTWDWTGDNGFKASNVMDVNQHTNETYILPLYQAKNSSSSDYEAGVGQGSHYYYDIVQFVAVKIMYTSDRNRNVIVQPASMVIPATLLTSVAPAGSSASGQTLITTFAPAKLTN